MADARKGREFEPSTINGYRISWTGEHWQVVKNSVIVYRYATRKGAADWAHKH